MKAIYKTLILSAGVIYFTSCSDFLDQSSPSEMNDETVFNNTYYTNLALNKVYGDLTQDQTYSRTEYGLRIGGWFRGGCKQYVE